MLNAKPTALVLAISLLASCPSQVWGIDPPPPGGGGTNTTLNDWSFSDTNWLSGLGYPPLSYANIFSVPGGDGNALLIDSTSPAFLKYNLVESDGTTNLILGLGSVLMWFSPDWSGTNAGGIGPGNWAPLIQVGEYTANASYGLWALWIDPTGTNLQFVAQDANGHQATYLTAPINWTNQVWHYIALTYSSTNTALYVDNQLLTNGLPVTVLPNSTVQATGFYIGSGTNGNEQAHGLIDDLSTYNWQLDGGTISGDFTMYGILFGDLMNLVSAPSYPTNSPNFDAVCGPGDLTCISTNTGSYPTNANVWLTNIVAGLATNGTSVTVTVTFSVAGGTTNVNYDLFGTTRLLLNNITNSQWAWMGQCATYRTYSLTNQLNADEFFVLGTPQDSDGDGLTDAYERLVSKTDPHNPCTSGDGIPDGWKVIWGLNPLGNNPAQVGQRANYAYYLEGWLSTVTGNRVENAGLDYEANVTSDGHP